MQATIMQPAVRNEHGPVACARGAGVSGVTPPPIDDWKRNENLSVWNDPPFFIQRLLKLLLCFSVLSNFLI